jgi:predicted AAA+ superfamily ATPase
MDDKKRILTEKINLLLKQFPAVIITGARQCGKTTLAKKIRPAWKYFDMEKESDYTRITSDLGLFFKTNPKNIIIDEAQEYPKLFKELRGVIDKNRKIPGRYILTGSSSYELLNQVTESLAGRVGIVELGTFKTNELFDNSLPDFYEIFKRKLSTETIEYILNLRTKRTFEDIMLSFLKGGYPEPALMKNNDSFSLWMENYYKIYIERDIRKLYPKLDIYKYRRFIRMIAYLSGTVINYSEIGRSIDTSDVTIKQYLDIAEGTKLWRNIPSFEKSKVKTLQKRPKGVFRDSGLIHYMQNINTIDDIMNYTMAGRDFESFIIEEIIKGLQSMILTNWFYYYYRTKSGAEIDLILDGNFGILPVEIKFGTNVARRQLQTMTNFINDQKLPLGIVINNGEDIELLTEKIIQVPAKYI